MKQWLSTIWMVFSGVGLAVAACSSSGQSATTSPPSDASNGDAGGNILPGADAGDPDAGDASDEVAAPSPQTFLRIAHVSPDMPTIDICVAPHGTTTFLGPLVGQLASSVGEVDDAAVPGLAYTQVSAYIPLDPGAYDVRIVSAGAASCDADVSLLKPRDQSDDGGAADGSLVDGGLVDAAFSDAGVDAGSIDASIPDDASTAGDAASAEDASAVAPGIPDTTNLPALVVNAYATLLIAGEMSPVAGDHALDLTILPDDSVLGGGAAELRFVNALPQTPSIDVGLGSASTNWLPLATDVAFAAASAQAGVGAGALDSNGYLPIAPVSGQAFSARPSASSDAGNDTAAAASVEIDQGAIATLIAIGGKTGDAANAPSLLLCIDNVPSASVLSDCSVAQ